MRETLIFAHKSRDGEVIYPTFTRDGEYLGELEFDNIDVDELEHGEIIVLSAMDHEDGTMTDVQEFGLMENSKGLGAEEFITMLIEHGPDGDLMELLESIHANST